MGTFTNNSATLNGALASANVDSVFSVVTNAADALATLKQARDVEKANGGEAIVPVLQYRQHLVWVTPTF